MAGVPATEVMLTALGMLTTRGIAVESGDSHWPCPVCARDGQFEVRHDDSLWAFCGCPLKAILAALPIEAARLVAPAGSPEPHAALQGRAGQGRTEQGSSSPFGANELPCPTDLPRPSGWRTPEDIRNIGHTPEAKLALPTLGIHAAVGERFSCVLPGHDSDPGAGASVWWDGRTRLLQYHDWHHSRYGGPEWLRLCDVRAALAYGRVRRLTGPEAARWWLRLWSDAGLIEPLEVLMPPLPEGTPASVGKVADGFALLVGLRWLVEAPGEPVVFSHRFAAAWSGVALETASKAIRAMLRLGVIHRVGQVGVSHQKPMWGYLPGAPIEGTDP